MALAAGTKLGPYELVSSLGAGGMGEVYRARDTRLDRTVAIKVLNSALIVSAELKARFEREARAISQLNHPHICTLHDIGHDNGTDFLVMEFIEGETLADRLRRGPLAIDQLLTIGAQIADALDKAHRAGIVHRDLKPGNVMLAKTGAKLLDFGLAKPLPAIASAAGSGTGVPSFTAAPTLSGPSPVASPLTSQGSIVGTIHYMSPEQIEGKEADARSDIFALGALLYEMTTARRPFEGKSQLKVASAILEDEPAAPATLRSGLPPALEHVIRTCLAKNPNERFQSALDVELDLQWIAREPTTQALVPKRHSRMVWILAAALVVTLAGLAYVSSMMRRPKPVVRASILPPPKTAIVALGPTSGFPVLSPDGTRIAYAARRADGQVGLWVRPLSAFSEQMLLGTDNASFPFWSPDGKYVAFFADGKLKKVDANGGSVETIADALQGRGGTWNEGGVIVFSPGPSGPLMKVSANGGQVTAATKLAPGQNGHRLPYFLSDNKHFLFFSTGAAGVMTTSAGGVAGSTSAGIYVGSLEDDIPPHGKQVLSSEWNAVYAATGHVLFVKDNTLMAAPFSMRRLEVTGPAVPVAQQVAANNGVFQGLFSISQTGVLLYQSAATSGGWQMMWYDQAGKAGAKLGVPGLYYAPELSPDGTKVAYHFRDNSGNTDIWVYDLTRNVPVRFTFDASVEVAPIWSPDGSTVYYSSNRQRGGSFNIFRKAANGMGSEEQVLNDPNSDCRPHAVTPDGKYLLYGRLDNGGAGNWEIWALPLDGSGKPFVVIKSGFANVQAQVSPDGKWLAYASNESGTYQIYVTPFPTPTAKWQVSNTTGLQPRWRHDGKELFYFNSGRVMAAAISAQGATFEAGVPRELFATTFFGFPARVYDVSRDGKRFLFTSGDVANSSDPVSIVLNWPETLPKQ